jgi:hypothetical protein
MELPRSYCLAFDLKDNRNELCYVELMEVNVFLQM